MVLGASFDSPKDNKAFADAKGFDFRLLSDVDRSVGERYGAGGGKWAKRVAYLIDPDGVISRAYQVSDIAGFAAQVVSDLAATNP